jgi:hypothetical protein
MQSAESWLDPNPVFQIGTVDVRSVHVTLHHATPTLAEEEGSFRSVGGLVACVGTSLNIQGRVHTL